MKFLRLIKIHKILNIAPAELPHVGISWFLGLISRMTMVLGWTILTVIFVSGYGIASLPFLFIFHATGIILGSLVFGSLLERFKREYYLMFIIIATAVILGLAASLDLTEIQVTALLIVALSVLQSQFKIVASLFTEELFTPSQSLRVFPVIESAETVGLIAGGLLISLLAPHLSLTKFLYIWMIIILMAVPALLYYLSNSVGIPFLELIHYSHESMEHDDAVHEHEFKGLLGSLKSAFELKFIKSLVLIVLLQWMFFNVLEFQYTKAIEESVTTSHANLVLKDMNEFGHGSVLLADKASKSQVSEAQVEESDISEASPVEVHGKVDSELPNEEYYEDFQNDFARDLAIYQVLFGVATLFFQLVLASRILSYLGVVGSMIIYPAVLLMSMTWMTINFNFGSAILTRFNHELGHVLHTNAYHSSYYALAHSIRGKVKEFLEGFVRPLGAILGTSILIAFTYIVPEKNLAMSINLMAVFVLIVMLFASMRMRPHYDLLPQNDLKKSKSLNVLINALDIILQNSGHHESSFLIDIHKSRNDLPFEVEKNLVMTIGEIGEAKDISYLIDLLKKKPNLSFEVVHAINTLFSKYSSEVREKPFTWYALTKLYQDLLRNANDSQLKAEIVSFIILSNYHKGLIDEIMYLLDNELDEETISVCSESLISVKDDHIVSFLEHLLEHDNPKVKAGISYVLAEYLKESGKIYTILQDMLESRKEDHILEALILIIKLDFIKIFSAYYTGLGVEHSENIEIMFLLRACYYHLGNTQLIGEYLYNDIGFDDLAPLAKVVEATKDPVLLRMFKRRVYSEIHELYVQYSKTINKKEKTLNFEQLRLLVRLQQLYKLVGAQKEYYLVEEIVR